MLFFLHPLLFKAPNSTLWRGNKKVANYAKGRFLYS